MTVASSRQADESRVPEPSSNGADYIWTLGNISLNLRNFRTNVGGQPIELSYREWELLRLMGSRPDQIIAYSDLTSALWGSPGTARRRTLSVLVHRLRAKLESSGPYMIRTVRGRGYGLVKPFDAGSMRG